MKFIIKIFSEIFIKSRSLKFLYIRKLINNINSILIKNNIKLKIKFIIDYIEITINNNNINYILKIIDLLINIPGIQNIFLMKNFIFNNIDDLTSNVINIYKNKLINKSFCLRVKNKTNTFFFKSKYIENILGKKIINNITNTTVNLINPDVKIYIHIIHNEMLIKISEYIGLGGYPIGTQGNVISMISGGYDSSVSSYMFIKKGCNVNYCFFNLRNSLIDENKIKKIVYFLWKKYSFSSKSFFVSVNFYTIINEILIKINNKKYNLIILKRMMIKFISLILKKLNNIDAIILGDSLGQVSSQTIYNINLTNNISNILILRPLISYNKETIINISKYINTYKFSCKIDEFCNYFFSKSSGKSKINNIIYEENKINYIKIFNDILSKIKFIKINKNFLINKNFNNIKKIKFVNKININDIVIDMREKNIKSNKNSCIKKNKTINISYYNLDKNIINNLNKNKSYILLCDNNFISNIKALFLIDNNFKNIKVFKQK